MPRGRPAYRPTDKDRAQVQMLASYGVDHEDICKLILNPQTGNPIDAKTLRKAFRAEIDTGMIKANAAVARSLFEQAVGQPAVYDEKTGVKLRAEIPRNIAAGIFWAKTRMGWKETSVHELEGKGGPIPIVITQNQAAY